MNFFALLGGLLIVGFIGLGAYSAWAYATTRNGKKRK